MTDPTTPVQRQASSLAAAFMLHELSENYEGRKAIASTLNEASDPQFLGTFVQVLARLGVNYGRRFYADDDQFRSELQRIIMSFQNPDDGP